MSSLRSLEPNTKRLWSTNCKGVAVYAGFNGASKNAVSREPESSLKHETQLSDLSLHRVSLE